MLTKNILGDTNGDLYFGSYLKQKNSKLITQAKTRQAD